MDIVAEEAAKGVGVGLSGVVVTGAADLLRLVRRRFGSTMPTDQAKLRHAILDAVRSDPRFAEEIQAALAPLAGTRVSSGRQPPMPFFDRDAVRAELTEPGAYLVAGMREMGKTALVLQIADDVADRYPDCVYVDLDEYRNGEALPAGAVQAAVLRLLGVSSIEEAPAALSDQYLRALLHRRCVLILDNALGADDVTSLVQPWRANLVLVTTRLLTEDLRRRSTTPPVILHGLDEGAAWAMLDRGCPGMLDAEPDAARALLALCNWSPFAIQQVAVRLSRRTGVTGAVAAVHRELATSDDPGEFIVRCLSRTVRELPDATVDALIALAAQPVQQLSYEAAAAALGDGVDRLIDASLVEKDDRGRVRLPDLIGDHARRLRRDRAVDVDTPFVRLMHFLRDRAVAADLDGGDRYRAYAIPPDLAWHPSWHPSLDWLEAELTVIVALLPYAYGAGLHTEVTQLCGALERLLTARGYHQQVAAVNEWGIRAAQALDDPALEARIHAVQARVFTQMRLFDRAWTSLAAAERLLATVDDPRLESSVGEVRARLEETLGNAAAAELAFRACLAIDERWRLDRGAGIHHRMLANLLVRLGRAAEALPLLDAAAMFTSRDEPGVERDRNEGRIHTVGARACLALGDLARARGALGRARALTAAATATQYEVELADLEAELAWRSGDPETARAGWSRIAQRYWDEGRDPRCNIYLDKLSELPPPPR